MKRKYIHMSMLIQGPKQPGININLYLQLLKDELDTLWYQGVNTWDRHPNTVSTSQQRFTAVDHKCALPIEPLELARGYDNTCASIL
jgi:hypothetical protein